MPRATSPPLFAAFGPLLYGLTVGVHFLPSVVALALLKRPGTAVLAGVIAGLVGAAFAPWWIGRFVGTGLLVGVLIELPFLLTRYRRWDAWMFYVAAVFSGLVLAIAVFIAPRRRALRVVGVGDRPAAVGRAARCSSRGSAASSRRGSRRPASHSRPAAAAGRIDDSNAPETRRADAARHPLFTAVVRDHTKWFARSRSSAKSISTA